MAQIIGRPNIELRIALELTESEARALDALVGYGDDAFLEVFYAKLGKAYMEEHEMGLRSLFRSVRDLMPALLSRTDDARQVFSGAAKKQYKIPERA